MFFRLLRSLNYTKSIFLLIRLFEFRPHISANSVFYSITKLHRLRDEFLNEAQKIMENGSISSGNYTYLHDCKWQSEAIDVHHVVFRKSILKALFLCVGALLFLAQPFSLLQIKDTSVTVTFQSFVLGAILIKILLWKPVRKESVVIMPSLGVQLETHYMGGRIVRRFVPAGKILKPVLIECVTPVTCYWSFSLILRGEEELMLVFKELRPPVKMLVPIWKALCAATVTKENPDTYTDKQS